MFARAEFNQFAAGMSAIDHAGWFRMLRRLPPGLGRSGVLSAAFLETWLRWPLATLKIGDRIDQTLATLDADGDRFGLTQSAKRQLKRNLLYNQLPDLVTLLNSLDSDRSRKRTLTLRGHDILARECESEPGAIVAGFRTGPYPAFPWALAAAVPEREVLMIVGTEHLAELARRLGRTFIGSLNERVTFVSAQDASVLARTLAALKQGNVVATLLELSPVEFQKKTPVRFLDWTIDVPFGFSYLSAMSGRPVIPAALTRRRGAQFRLTFREPVAAAGRSQESIKSQTQALYGELERQVRAKPDQWIGWMLLDTNMGIELPAAGGQPLTAIS